MPVDADVIAGVVVSVVVALGTIAVAVIGVAGTIAVAYSRIRPALRALKDDTEKVRHEIEHNSGGSIKDAIKRIEGRQERDYQWQRDVNTWRKDQDRLTRAQAVAIQEIREQSQETHEALAQRITEVDERTQP